MIQVDVPITFAIGTLFADSARRQLRTNPEYGCRVLLRANLYYLFFFSWIPICFLLNYFGWETSHMWWHGDSVADYPFFVPLFMIVLSCGLNGGFLLGFRRRSIPWTVWFRGSGVDWSR